MALFRGKINQKVILRVMWTSIILEGVIWTFSCVELEITDAYEYMKQQYA